MSLQCLESVVLEVFGGMSSGRITLRRFKALKLIKQGEYSDAEVRDSLDILQICGFLKSYTAGGSGRELTLLFKPIF